MIHRRMRAPAFLLMSACALAAAPFSASARPSKASKKPAAAPVQPASAAPKIQAAVESLLDRRTTGDFPRASLTLTLVLQGEDAKAVKAARPKITRAVDDTGTSLVDEKGSVAVMRGSDGWQESRGEGPMTSQIEMLSPSRKARSLTSVEGVVEAFLPSRDPGSTVRIDGVLSKKDKPLTVPALASKGVRIQVLSKAGLEREKKQAEAKKAAEAKKKKKPEGLEGMAQAMADVLVGTIGSLFSSVGEHDLILKVHDPGKKIFSFDLAAPDGTPIQSYGATDVEGYRILRMFEAIPEKASLQVRLKTPRSFGVIPFSFSNVKLP